MGAMCKMIQAEQILLDISVADKTECIKRADLSAGRQRRPGGCRGAFRRCSDPGKTLYHSTGLRMRRAACPFRRSQAHGDRRRPTGTPVDFSAEDGESVKLVFLMAGPKQNTGLHLKVLSKLARLLHDSSIREELMKVQEPGAFYAQLCPEGG
jgi:hypothetical protein